MRPVTKPMELIKEAKHATWKEPFCFPGGYERRVILSDGEVICRDCVKANWRELVSATLHEPRNGWAIAGVGVLWEGPPSICPQCNKELPTEYGDPDEKESRGHV